MKKDSKKKGVVFAGGGTRGSYQLGAWEALRELDFLPDIVTGTSIGAVNGALMVQNDYDKARELWLNTTTEQVFDLGVKYDFETLKGTVSVISAFLREVALKGGLDSSNLKMLIENCVFEEKIRESRMDFGIVSVSLPDMKPCVLFKEEIPRGMMRDYILASCSCFPAIRPYSIEKKQYIDGAYYDNMPVESAVFRGAKDIVAVDLKGLGRNRKVTENGDLYIRHVFPYWDLGLFLVFSELQTKKNIRLGYLDTMKAFGVYEGAFYCMKKGQIRKNAERLYRVFMTLWEELHLAGRKDKPSPESLAEYAFERAFKSRTNLFWNTEGMLSCFAEAAGEIFELDPMKIYNFEEYNKELFTCFLAQSLPSFKQIARLESFLEVPAVLERTLKEVDKRTLLLFIFHCIQDFLAGKDKNNGKLLLCQGLFPAEFGGAVYLSVLNKLYHQA